MDPGLSTWFLASFEVKVVEVVGPVRHGSELYGTVRNADLSEVVSKGTIYLQAPSGHFLEALAAAFPDSFRYLAVGTSATWSVALSPDSDGSPVHCEAMVVDGMVRIGRVGR